MGNWTSPHQPNPAVNVSANADSTAAGPYSPANRSPAPSQSVNGSME